MRAMILTLVGVAAACGEDGLQRITEEPVALTEETVPEPAPAARRGSGPGLGGAEPGDVETIDAVCAGGTTVSEFQVRFEDPARPCDWAMDGNVNMIDGYITARIEQDVTLDLPS
ncbi:MAG: hypothetical protein AAF658_18375, partial [Myxococcota bacterium]